MEKCGTAIPLSYVLRSLPNYCDSTDLRRLLTLSEVNVSFSLPVYHRPVILIISLAIAPGMSDLLGEGLFVQFDSQAGPRRHIDIAFADDERLLEIAFAEADLFLAQEVGNGRGELNAGGQRDGAQRIVRGDGGVVGLGHAGNEADLGDAPRVAQVGLQDGGRLLLQHFAKAPLGEDALARGDRQVGAAGDLR